MSKFIKNFKQLTKKNVDIAGGKGASLGEMINAKIPVPSGFVILANVFDRFLEETDLTQEIKAQLKKVNYDDVNSVDRASNVIRDLIHDAKMPKDLEKEISTEFKKTRCRFVAVRSSATAEDSSVASWAGELESYLNTTGKMLLENVKKCWSSLFTPRAIFYRKEKKLLKTNVSVAVVIQKMIESEISGITFTVHPVTQDKNQMIIEAGYGLGEAIVSGSITPDSYVVEKSQIQNYKSQINLKSKIQNSKQLQFEILDINVAEQKKQIVRCLKNSVKWISVPKSKQEKQKLTGKEIIKLSKICIQIEKHYKKPQDIEWAFRDGKFYIVQSRPITTL
ncbi:MAG: PEP/pyruvate-binding domain-containing protein [Patescibacteria group bacterium]|nr:PEP/pyruvate-binding domain-containing protein [Patescibacteria group bacterium]